jgi:hypothetical protein
VSAPKHTTHADVELALVGAENLLRGTRQRRRLLLFARIVLIVVAMLAAAVAVARAAESREAFPSAAVVAAAFLVSLVVALAVVSQLRRRVTAQEREMVKSVNWVREVFPLVAEREKWSAPQRESVRQRVAQFPIVSS